MIAKKNVSKIYFYFIFFHLVLWTLAPSLSNENLPLDTIEALAWGSNLDWGFNKHPPLSAFAVEFIYSFFGSNDWAYYFLSQIFVIISFIYVWKLANEIFENKVFCLISLIILESIFFFNFTTPEFNVNISQLPFWAICVYFFWKAINLNKTSDWICLGIFSALGFLSKYLFIYLLVTFFLYLLSNFKNNKKLIKNYFISVSVTFLILAPHFVWLYQNEFVTIFYGLNRSGLDQFSLINHFTYPAIFLIKQLIILIPFFFSIIMLIEKFNFKLNLKNKKILFLIFITLLPLSLILLTSLITGAKIRTMWMTPFYLFFGILFIDVLKRNINLNKIKRFTITIAILFFLSPSLYLFISFYDDKKRTDYPGREIARLVQNKWDDNFQNEIKVVIGDEWSAGNLSYHLSSRPKWLSDLKGDTSIISENQGVIYTGNPKILKKICPGVFGSIKPVGYCMIGKR